MKCGTESQCPVTCWKQYFAWGRIITSHCSKDYSSCDSLYATLIPSYYTRLPNEAEQSLIKEDQNGQESRGYWHSCGALFLCDGKSLFFFFFPTGLHKATSQLQKTRVHRCMDSHILVHVTASLKAKSWHGHSLPSIFNWEVRKRKMGSCLLLEGQKGERARGVNLVFSFSARWGKITPELT